MASIHLITFGGGGRNFERAARRLVRQSLGFLEIVTARAFGPDDLDDDYNEMFPDFAQRYPRGYGLWSWKPYLICRHFENIPDGEYILYLDAGCELNHDGRSRFQDYLDFAQKNDVFIIQLESKNIKWTKSDARLFPTQTFEEEDILQSGILLFKVCKRTKNLVLDWLHICALDDGYLLKDVDGEPQSPRFIEHRHDQSCLTAVAAKYGIRGFHDETWYPVSPIKAFLTNTSDKPILALRNKDGVSFLPLIRFLSWFLKLKRD